MGTDGTTFGDRMKSYEEVTRLRLPRRTYGIVRVDGRAFHTHLKRAVRPFDPSVSNAMEAVAEVLCQEISGAKLAYQQSDEVSVVFTDFDDIHSEAWFGGVVQKIASVCASIASAEFNWAWGTPGGRLATFDGRVYSIPSQVEVMNYLLWRQRDALRNSVQSVAQHYFPPRRLHGLGNDQLQELLYQEFDVNWSDFPVRHKQGSVIVRQPVIIGGGRTTPPVGTSGWKAMAAPKFVVEPCNFLAAVIPPVPSLAEQAA